jgi:hypothetical protein
MFQINIYSDFKLKTILNPLVHDSELFQKEKKMHSCFENRVVTVVLRTTVAPIPPPALRSGFRPPSGRSVFLQVLSSSTARSRISSSSTARSAYVSVVGGLGSLDLLVFAS